MFYSPKITHWFNMFFKMTNYTLMIIILKQNIFFHFSTLWLKILNNSYFKNVFIEPQLVMCQILFGMYVLKLKTISPICLCYTIRITEKVNCTPSNHISKFSYNHFWVFKQKTNDQRIWLKNLLFFLSYLSHIKNVYFHVDKYCFF